MDKFSKGTPQKFLEMNSGYIPIVAGGADDVVGGSGAPKGLRAPFGRVMHLFRVTTNASFKDWDSWFSIFGLSHYVISCEIGKQGKMHYHLVLCVSPKFYNDFGKHIKKLDSEINSRKFARNGEVEDIQKTISYVVKEGVYQYEGFSQKEIDGCMTLSYRKYGNGSDMMKLLSDNEKDYLVKEEYSLNQWMLTYIDIKCSYNQSYSNKYLEERGRLLYHKKYPGERSVYVAERCMRVQMSEEKIRLYFRNM